jgi:hypothetical protein
MRVQEECYSKTLYLSLVIGGFLSGNALSYTKSAVKY